MISNNLIPTHYHPDTFDFYESEFFVEDGQIKYYKITKDNLWREVDKRNKYERHPGVEDMEEIK